MDESALEAAGQAEIAPPSSWASRGIAITDVKVVLRSDALLKAFVTITLNGCFMVRGVKIMRGHRKLFVAMPSHKRPDGSHEDLVHPIDGPIRQHVQQVVLDRYEREMHRLRIAKIIDLLERD